MDLYRAQSKSKTNMTAGRQGNVDIDIAYGMLLLFVQNRHIKVK